MYASTVFFTLLTATVAPTPPPAKPNAIAPISSVKSIVFFASKLTLLVLSPSAPIFVPSVT